MPDNPFKVHKDLILGTQQHAKTIFEDALEYIVGHSYDATRKQEYSALKYEIEVRESCLAPILGRHINLANNTSQQQEILTKKALVTRRWVVGRLV
jgi:hypothetical protein